MMKYSEKDILSIIRWAPILFIIILSVIITFIEILDNQKRLQQDVKIIKSNFIKQNNSKIEENTNKIFDYINYIKKESENNLKKMLKNRVYEAHQIANNIYKENQDKSKEEILKSVKDALRDIRFNDNRGYYFMHDKYGNNQLYPPKKEGEGNNYSELKDIKGYLFVQKIKDVIKNKTESFDSYYWSKPVEERVRVFKKVAFYKYFAPLNMTISSGEYLEDFESDLKKSILSYIAHYNSITNDYIFIVDKKGKILSHKNTKIISTNILDYNKIFAKKIKSIWSENDVEQVYLNYEDRYSSTLVRDKVSFIKLFKQWKWFIGTGYYKDDLNLLIKNKKDELNNESNEKIMYIIKVSSFATFVLLLITIYLSNLVSKKFISYNNKLIKEMNESRKKDSVLAQQNKMASMGEMIGNIAHQWRQPLSAISTLSSGLKMKKEFGLLDENELTTSLDQITNTTRYLSKTIDDFRNFFKQDKRLEKVSAKELWANVHDLLGSQFKKDEIDFILDIEDCKFEVLRNELIQVLINLLNNSKDQFKLKNIEHRYIFVRIFKNKDYLTIEIKDSGNGVNIDILDRIFEPYFTTKHKSQGTGIGLYMCEQIIRNNIGGNIAARNTSFTYHHTLLKGLTTVITLPIK